jgi:hypothetical protein
MKKLIESLKQAIIQNQSSQALSLLRQGFSKSEREFLEKLRKNGVLRCSCYDFNIQILQPLIDGVLAEKYLSTETRSYFESLNALIFVARNIQKIYKDLIKEIDSINFKSYLVTVDSLFWKLHIQNYIKTYHLFNLSREEIASAFSILFYHSKDKNKLNAKHLDSIDIKGIRDNHFLKKLADFYKIVNFRENEILVDYFGYKAVRQNNRVIVEAPDARLEMSICWGYTSHRNQHIAASIKPLLEEDNSDTVSYIKFVIDMVIERKDKFFSIAEHPYKRIVMKFPSEQFLDEFAKFIRSNQLFGEEIDRINFLKKELFIDRKQIYEEKFYKDLQLIDIIKFERLFLFLLGAFEAYITSENLSNSKLFWRSILPVFERKQFLDLLGYFWGERKAEQLLELLSWNPPKIFDVQYHPILCIDNWIILPLGILGHSNLPRNVLQSTGYRFDSDSSNDPIGKLMEESIKPISSFFAKDIPYKFNGQSGEIDVIAVIDNYLFVFECKNSLHPTSPFELRISYDYIRKGAKQLTKFRNLWKEQSFQDYLSTKLKHSLPSKLYTCIITGNRMFSGWREQGHSIRPIYELRNIVQSGEISAKLLDVSDKTLEGQTLRVWKVWKGDTFKVEDLIEYIEKDSLHQCYFDSMSIKDENCIGYNTITRKTYKLDEEKLFQEIDKKFEVVRPPH